MGTPVARPPHFPVFSTGQPGQTDDVLQHVPSVPVVPVSFYSGVFVLLSFPFLPLLFILLLSPPFSVSSLLVSFTPCHSVTCVYLSMYLM